MSEWVRSQADEKAVAAGCWFDVTAAERVRTFFAKFLRLSQGRFAGKPFDLQPWQWETVIAPLFGWKRPDGSRRFRRASIWIPKKNGKSTLAAGLILYGLLGDGEAAAEVFSAAVDRNQAAIVFRECARMVQSSPALAQRLDVIESSKRITYPTSSSYFEVLSKDAKKSGHGKNIHFAVIDEVHVVNREMYDTLRYGGASRHQPLLIEISTAGNDKTSLGYERYQYAQQVLAGVADDPELLAFVAEADSNDVWDQPEQWRKANPSLGVTITEEGFRGDFNEARQGTANARANFCQLRLNIWQDAVEGWLPMDRWDECGGRVDVTELDGLECYAGLDLASTTDTASLVLLFPQRVEDGEDTVTRYTVLLFCWIPESACLRRERENRTRFDGWVREGHAEKTSGDVIDYDVIRAKLNVLNQMYNIREVAIDRWNSTQLATQLQGDGFEVVAFGQGFASMSAPTKELEGLVLSGRLRHGGNPVLRWMASNCTTEQDAAGNLKPSKKRSSEKIDGIVALVMALGRALVQPEESAGGVEFW